MNRNITVAFALFASCILVTALPVGASHGELVAASDHSGADLNEGKLTHSEFVDAEDPYIQLGAEETASGFDGFEDGSADGWTGHSGETLTAQSTTVNSGSYAAELSVSSDGYDNAVTLDDANVSFGVATISAQFNSPDAYSHPQLVFRSEADDQYNLRANIGGDTLEIRRWEDGRWERVVSADATLSTDTWYNLSFTYDSRSGELEGEIRDSNGVSQTVEGVDTTLSPTMAGVGAYQATTYWDDVSWSHETTVSAGSYQSANHTVATTNTREAWTNLELENASASVEWQGFDNSTGSWQVVNSTTYSSSGNRTLDIDGTNYETWRVNVSFETTGSDPTATLHDEGVLAETVRAEVDDSSLSPNTTETSTDDAVTLSADISDPDFASHGDTATVHWYVDGKERATTSASSNGTVEYTLNSVEAGEHNWHIEVDDEYGHRTTSATATFAAPGELEIYNESSPSELVQGANTTVELRFYFGDGDGQVVEGQTSDGTINMSGLPVDESFVVVADAKGYYPRRIFVQSLLQTQKVYLLPEGAEAVEPVFDLQDYSGQYPAETTVLQLQRSLNGSWQTVTGDFFGANGKYPTQLERNVRHRLVLIDTTTGEERVLGTYTPLASGEQLIEVSASGDIEIRPPPVVNVNPDTGSLPALSGTTVTAHMNARGGDLDYWSANATYHEGGSVTTLQTVNKTADGSADLKVDLSDRVNGTLKVTVTYRVDGATATEIVEYDISKSYQNEYSLLNTVGRIDTLVPAGNRADFKVFVALIATVILTTGTVRQIQASTEMAGLTAVGCIAGFSIIGWMTYDVLFASVVAFGAFAAVRRGL